MATAPVIEWRNSTSPFAVITSLALTGSGVSGAVIAGNSSNVATVRIYNNFAAAGGVASADICTLACYDDITHQGQATTEAVVNQEIGVGVINYNGSTSQADPSGAYYRIGGTTKHLVPTNNFSISGTGSNYITVVLVVLPYVSASAGSRSVGVWLEYNSTA